MNFKKNVIVRLSSSNTVCPFANLRKCNYASFSSTYGLRTASSPPSPPPPPPNKIGGGARVAGGGGWGACGIVYVVGKG